MRPNCGLQKGYNLWLIYQCGVAELNRETEPPSPLFNDRQMCIENQEYGVLAVVLEEAFGDILFGPNI